MLKLNNKYSPFQLKGDIIEKQVIKSYLWFSHSPLVSDLNLKQLDDNVKLLNRFRDYFFNKFPDLLQRLKEEEVKHLYLKSL